MNPNATPENIAAAKQAIIEQTQATVARMNEERLAVVGRANTTKLLEKAFGALESRSRKVLDNITILGASTVLASIQDEDPTRTLYLHSGDRTTTLVIDTADKDLMHLLSNPDARFALDLRLVAIGDKVVDEVIIAPEPGQPDDDDDDAAAAAAVIVPEAAAVVPNKLASTAPGFMLVGDVDDEDEEEKEEEKAGGENPNLDTDKGGA